MLSGTVVLKEQTQCLDPPHKFYILVLQPKSDLQVWQPIGLLVSACASNFSECFLPSVAGNCLCQCAPYQQLSMCGELLSKSRICLTALLIFNKSTSTTQPAYKCLWDQANDVTRFRSGPLVKWGLTNNFPRSELQNEYKRRVTTSNSH